MQIKRITGTQSIIIASTKESYVISKAEYRQPRQDCDTSSGGLASVRRDSILKRLMSSPMEETWCDECSECRGSSRFESMLRLLMFLEAELEFKEEVIDLLLVRNSYSSVRFVSGFMR